MLWFGDQSGQGPTARCHIYSVRERASHAEWAVDVDTLLGAVSSWVLY